MSEGSEGYGIVEKKSWSIASEAVIQSFGFQVSIHFIKSPASP